MSILTGNQIMREIERKTISISRFNAKQLNPNSYNLRLGRRLLVYDGGVLDMKSNNPYTILTIPNSGFVMERGKCYLGETVEETWTDSFVPMIEGRSSVGRLFLPIHITAGFGDVGWRGKWTLEFVPFTNIRVYPGVEIAQIYFHTIFGKKSYYGGGTSKYQNADGVEASKMYLDFVGETSQNETRLSL